MLDRQLLVVSDLSKATVATKRVSPGRSVVWVQIEWDHRLNIMINLVNNVTATIQRHTVLDGHYLCLVYAENTDRSAKTDFSPPILSGTTGVETNL